MREIITQNVGFLVIFLGFFAEEIYPFIARMGKTLFVKNVDLQIIDNQSKTSHLKLMPKTLPSFGLKWRKFRLKVQRLMP